MGLTATGKENIAALIGGLGSPAGAYDILALDADDTAFDKTQTAPGSELTGDGLDQADANISQGTSVDNNDTIIFQKAWTYSGTSPIDVNAICLLRDLPTTGQEMGVREVLPQTRTLQQFDTINEIVLVTIT